MENRAESCVFSSRPLALEREKTESGPKSAKSWHSQKQQLRVLVARIHRRAQAKVPGVFGAKKKVQVGI